MENEAGSDPCDLEAQSLALLKALNLRISDAYVSYGTDRWIVVIFARRKKPPIVKWMGLPVEYQVGVGQPEAYAST